MLRWPEAALETNVITEQLMEAIPESNYIGWGQRGDLSRVRIVVRKWVYAAEKWIQSTSTSTSNNNLTDSLALAKATIDEHRAWIFEQSRSERSSLSAADAISRFATIREKCRPFFLEACKPAIEAICQFLVDSAHKIVKKLDSLTTNVESQAGQADNNVQLDHDDSTNCFAISFKSDVQQIRKLHAEKLRALFEIHHVTTTSTNEEEKENEFLARLWILLRRYQSLFGDPPPTSSGRRREGASFHAAAPETVFDVLKERFGVRHECFASPLNCHFASFCSAFPDSDHFFGSVGSFFDFFPRTGSFEVGPPYTVEVMDRAARHCDSLLLENATTCPEEPLSFIVFVPDWRTPLQPAQEFMEHNKFLRADIAVKGNEHSYVVGDQHIPGRERYFLLPFTTHVYVLQNDAGHAKWPPTGENLQLLRAALEKRNRG